MPYTLSNINDTPCCQIHAVKFLPSEVKYLEMHSKTTGWEAEIFCCNMQQRSGQLSNSSETLDFGHAHWGKSGCRTG